jgi:O-antigen/teichoic acid export membrane protein
MTLFGEAWLSAVPILQVLCLAGVFWPLHVINLNVLLAQGHSKLFFKLELLKKGLGVALLLAGARYGVMGIAWSQVVFGVLAFLINARYSGRFLGYGASAQTRDCIPMVAVSALMTATVFVAGRACQLNPFLSLSLLSALGAFTYLGLGWLVQLEALTEALDILKQRLTARDLPRTESAGRTA